jgi:uncharacterized protein (TIGR00369 family)
MGEERREQVPFELGAGWAGAMGLEFLTITKDEVVVEWTVADRHKQPFGIVHGGVHCGVIETICSVGAGLNAAELGLAVVGVENHTSFLRPVRSGRLRAVGTPIQKGKRAHLWEGRILDEAGKLVATGRVRLFCVPREDAGP